MPSAVIPVTLVTSELGEAITGVTGPDIKDQVGLPAPNVPDTEPFKVVEEPQRIMLPPAFAVQFCAFTAADSSIRLNSTIPVHLIDCAQWRVSTFLMVLILSLEPRLINKGFKQSLRKER